MRGKGQGVLHFISPFRITPAYAGKSRRSWRLKLHVKDHPRLCGEKPPALGTSQPVGGSPPPMRGKVAPLGQGVLHFRITPAYAGKSSRFWCGFLRRWDHPRLCGEKAGVLKSLSHDSGSPPPMRGKVCPTARVRLPAGITPAYAGKRDTIYQSYNVIQDHPRLCGEKAAGHRTRQGNLGSPPPMRGKVLYGCPYS